MSQTSYGHHVPVLLNHCLNLLLPAVDQPVLLDLTFGAGGHSGAFLAKYPDLTLVAVDQDEQAIINARQMIESKQWQDRVELVHQNFLEFMKETQQTFDLILADIGVSSHQLDCDQRGFSFQADAALDMRMDQNQSFTAYHLVNEYSQEELIRVIREYGEERYWQNIVSNIVEQRARKKILTTKQLENICFHSYPARTRFKGIHPATRTFQAIRIEVNRELDVLKEVIPLCYEKLNQDGSLGIISFHSLEDRIVKQTFKEIAHKNENCAILTKKPLVATEHEIKFNKRSRSAKLRVLKKSRGNNEKKKKRKKDSGSLV